MGIVSTCGNGKNYASKYKKAISFSTVFVTIVFVGLSLFSFTFLLNGFHKIVPIGQVETEAVIASKHSEREWQVYHFRFDTVTDPLFQFELNYTDQDGVSRRVIKEVTHHTFHQYDAFDSLPISYRSSNPFDIFVRGTTLTDVLDIFFYRKFFLFSFMFCVAVLFGVISIRRLYKKRRKG
ncbi:hypothetical protein ACFPTR_03665 [Aliibacillus thermotolerans]|uniref:DUF3592 domain-containing protein n=1 Tax=Aliibacillus thermotolerans TaxID=1834418 RepID=A0ABW0U3F7_9BACI|nr:hypothetical protein [Aliibacillus thermotolerans]MDA3129451.1 hypothetical protein [Aliibacillus thermotolerans]